MIIKTEVILQSKHHSREFSADIRYVSSSVKKPIILLVHGFKGFKDSMHFNVMADEFAQAGFVIMKMNFSHNGTNPENPQKFVDLDAFSENNFTIEMDDMAMAIDSIAHQKLGIPINEIDTEQIYLIGHSRGGGIAMIKACEDNRIKKIVTWGAVTDFVRFWPEEALKQWEQDQVYYVFNARTLQQMPMKYQFVEDFLASGDRYKIAKQLPKLDRPMLAIHGSEDETVPLDSLHVLTEANKAIHTHVIDGANHTFGGKHPWKETELPDQAVQLLQHTIAFLKFEPKMTIPTLLKCYLRQFNDDKNQLVLTSNHLMVYFKGTAQTFQLGQIKSMVISPKKLIIALVIGGIGTSLSMLALSLGWYPYYLNLTVIALFFTLMYYGFVGKEAIVITEESAQHIFLLTKDKVYFTEFVNFVNQRKWINRNPSEELIYHISKEAHWSQQELSFDYTHDSIAQEGFIHCSNADQVIESYHRYHSIGEPVILLSIQPKMLLNELKYEWAAKREDHFPHVMGTINKTALVDVSVLTTTEELKEILERVV